MNTKEYLINKILKCATKKMLGVVRKTFLGIRTKKQIKKTKDLLTEINKMSVDKIKRWKDERNR